MYQMILRLQRLPLVNGGDIFLRVELLELFPGPALPHWID
jgi:hypothetical protein